MYLYDIVFPFILFIIITIIFWATDLDIILEKKFYDKEKGWYLQNKKPWIYLYDYGRYPGAIVFILSFIVYILSFFIDELVKFRTASLFLFLFMFIGAGIFINSILKIYWERPRPKQLKQFGGEHNYVNVWFFGNGGRNSSFPCGHASIGFYLIFPYFFLKATNPELAFIFLGLGIIFGFIVGLARMVQGGHFASDVIWALGVMYFTGIILYYLMNLNI